MLYTAWVCKACDVEGTDPEHTREKAWCWNCGKPAHITARVTVPA